ncbi:hypothetical protein [Chitinophaga qingshengii]|uniref:Nuclear transport factor 2 family protein n=1 Tax=Chitinophaga qingshengii TaxID=1569794 RepID=A0ABR7TJH9_9BACT|nr:hypothetical protein [Chitinophaga qingshengii]MBC9930150.1 hypothetical protein [Chitinophaga qingshengii]
MRKISLFVAIAILAACNSGTNESNTGTATTSGAGSEKQESLNYPFTASYSSDFEIGSTKNVQTLLNVYQHWDNNVLDKAIPSFAENDTIFFADGGMFAGSRDSLFAVAKKMREPLGMLIDSIHAWVPLRSKDKKEDWVIVWTRQISTDAQGKRTATELQETWRFDKNGKINLMYQYAQQPPRMPKK